VVGGCEGAIWSSDLSPCSFQSLKGLLRTPVSVRLLDAAEVLTGEVTSWTKCRSVQR
jgi:hypothetical protein